MSQHPLYRRGYASALERLDVRLSALRRRSGRIDTLLRCTAKVGVSQAGDARHRWGFLYDERDGTGTDLRPALTRDRSRPRWFLLRSATSARCLSRPADPNGAGDDARPAVRSAAAVGGLRGLLRHLRRLEATTAAVTRHTERFDDWESCLSWLPITEDGDMDQHLGFLRRGGQAPGPAVHLDASEWDDPDYQILAFRRADRPFRDDECGSDPGEGVDRTGVPRPATRRTTWTDLREGIRDLREDVADLGEPVEDISRFDECLYTVGLTTRTGYRFRTRQGRERSRGVLAFDMRGPQLPDMSVLAFPGEEPPQIECNEDAGSVDTDE